jgi:hypothetical protein
LLRLARTGAANRVRELQAELEDIYKAFPDLRGGRAVRAARAAAGGGRTRKKRVWSAAQKKEVSERMRRYWAARRSKGAAKKG